MVITDHTWPDAGCQCHPSVRRAALSELSSVLAEEERGRWPRNGPRMVTERSSAWPHPEPEPEPGTNIGLTETMGDVYFGFDTLSKLSSSQTDKKF